MTNKGFSSQPGPRAVSPGVAEGAREDMAAERLRASTPAQDATALADSLKRVLLDIDFMVERGVMPDVRDDIIYQNARASLRATSQTPDAEGAPTLANNDPVVLRARIRTLEEIIEKQADEVAASPQTPDAVPLKRQVDKYGIALMMISQGCADPIGVADKALAKGWHCKVCGWQGEMPNTKVVPDAMGTAQVPCCPECDQHSFLFSRSTPSASAGPQAEAVALNHEGARRYAEAVFDYTDENLTKFDAMDADPALAQQLFDAAKALLAMLNGSFPTVLAHPQPQQADGRGAVIEECAQIAEAQNWCGGGAIVCGDVIARRIRALQQSPATDQGDINV